MHARLISDLGIYNKFQNIMLLLQYFFTDVVIGAPYEDAGRGAVYIYQGIGQCNCKMEDKFSQRISG